MNWVNFSWKSPSRAAAEFRLRDSEVMTEAGIGEKGTPFGYLSYLSLLLSKF